MGKKQKLPYDTRGGVIAYQRRILSSPSFLKLSAQAKVLIFLLQEHWRNDRPVGYGIREACEKVPCDRKTAMKAFKELENYGFIKMIDDALFNSRTGSKSRTWRLTWKPYMDREPTNDWEKMSE